MRCRHTSGPRCPVCTSSANGRWRYAQSVVSDILKWSVAVFSGGRWRYSQTVGGGIFKRSVAVFSGSGNHFGFCARRRKVIPYCCGSTVSPAAPSGRLICTPRRHFRRWVIPVARRVHSKPFPTAPVLPVPVCNTDNGAFYFLMEDVQTEVPWEFISGWQEAGHERNPPYGGGVFSARIHIYMAGGRSIARCT